MSTECAEETTDTSTDIRLSPLDRMPSDTSTPLNKPKRELPHKLLSTTDRRL